MPHNRFGKATDNVLWAFHPDKRPGQVLTN